MVSYKTWDPEDYFPQSQQSQPLLGVLTGEFLRSTKPETEKVIWLFLAGEVLLFSGLFGTKFANKQKPLDKFLHNFYGWMGISNIFNILFFN